MDQSTSPTGSSTSGPNGPTGSTGPAGTPDDAASADPATGAGAGDATPQDGTDDGGPGAATSGGADATVTRVDADDPDEQADAEDDAEAEADRQRRLEEFAQEHDPEKHDLAAGEEFRQRGDWTADAAGGEQKWDADGNLVEGSSPAVPQAGGDDADADGDAGTGTTGGRRTSSFEEVRDGGYSVGSAAPLDDGAMPLGHPVKGWEGSRTYASPGDEQYDTGEPHVWFTDEGAAERAGFHRA